MGVRERRNREKEARRQAILAAAEAVFSQKGFQPATVEDVAERAELAVGTLYLYFSSKEELFVSMILDAMDVFREGLQSIEGSSQPPAGKRRALWDLFIRFREEHPMYYKALLYLHDEHFTKYLSRGVREALLRRSGENFQLGARILAGTSSRSVEFRRAIDLMWSTFLGLVYLQDARKNLSSSYDPEKDRSFLRKSFAALETGLGGLLKGTP